MLQYPFSCVHLFLSHTLSFTALSRNSFLPIVVDTASLHRPAATTLSVRTCSPSRATALIASHSDEVSASQLLPHFAQSCIYQIEIALHLFTIQLHTLWLAFVLCFSAYSANSRIWRLTRFLVFWSTVPLFSYFWSSLHHA